MNRKGYTLIELMLVVAIMAVLLSIVSPRYDLLLQKAHQSKTRSNLATIRTSIALYYSDTETYPLSGYGAGNGHYTSNQLSLTSVLSPRWISSVPIPQLKDRAGGINGIDSLNYDIEANKLMGAVPPNDVFIVLGPADFTPLLVSPYAYDSQTGLLYIPNWNLDTSAKYFFTW